MKTLPETMLEKAVEKEIRKKYSLNDELKIQRQREVAPEAFAEYNAYVEECIAAAKARVEEAKAKMHTFASKAK